MTISANIVGFLLPQTSASAALTTLITGGAGSVQSSPATAVAALRSAQANEAREVARKAEEPQVQRELARFREVLARATSPEELLNDRVARTVLLTANGLGASVDAPGLARRALLGDYDAENHAAQQLREVTPAWLGTAQKYDFNLAGLDILRLESSIKEVETNYTNIRWQEDLERRAPGLSFAMTFIKTGANLDRAVEVLGNRVAREVITGAFGIPQQIALQPLETQVAVIERRIDVTRLADENYREDIARRYLIQRNAGNSGAGSIASLFA
jgi:hypothetical protein